MCDMEASELSATYKDMSKDFRDRGLDLDFVMENSTNYDITAEGCFPLEYSALLRPLSERAVRLFVLPLEEAPDLVSAAGQISRSIAALLPAGTRSYENPASLLHITIFHFSRPDDPRPMSMTADGADAIQATPIHKRPGPTDEEIARERHMMSDLVSSTPPISRLEVDSIVFAPSGTLLIVYTDQGPDVGALRAHLRKNAPGAPSKQASIIHTTLLRVLTPVQLPGAVIAAIHECCQRWTQELRGTKLCITRAWYIIEKVFSTIDGERNVNKFGTEGSA